MPELPAGIPDLYEDHVKLLFDLQALAFQADVTRVGTFMLARETSYRTYNQIGVPDPHHSTSHHGNDPDKLEKLAKINTYHMSLFAYFLDKLRSTADGDGTLLDHSMILYGGGMSNSNVHSHVNMPELLVGGAAGRLKGGRHLVYPDHTPMANLLVSILDKMNVKAESIGDSTGRLSDV